jgi:hypothetical protein
LRKSRARAQVDDAAQTAFAIGRGWVLDDVDATNLFAGNSFQRTVLNVAAVTAAGRLASPDT